ncbi:MAG TPA: hypothetical protein PK890_11160, partial [Terrimesophilobacter sp.]|nr:hypothetical protein [Terrimesophilobacter sp.]
DTVDPTPIAVGDLPTMVAVSPDGTTAYVPNEGDNTVSVINVATRSVVDTIAVGTQPEWVAFSPDGARA